MSVEGVGSEEVQDLVTRASDLMIEALILLDRASVAHSAALLDNAIAVLPKYDVTPKKNAAELDIKLGLRHSASKSSIRR